MRLSKLLYGIVDISFDAEIAHITCNPKKVKKDSLFICVSDDGKYNIHSVASSGAVAVVTDEYIDLQVRHVILHTTPLDVYRNVVSRFYGFKQPKYTAAVTGTNGKTSVVEFCRQIWRNAGYKSASVGTLGTLIDDDCICHNNNLTTPDSNDLYAILRDINNKSIEYLAIEASSHGLDQYRIHGLKLDSAAFTNLSHDHFDYHKGAMPYLDSKKKLFSEVLQKKIGIAVLNADIDEYTELHNISERCGNEVMSYGMKGCGITLLEQTANTYGQFLTIKICNMIYNTFFSVLGKFQAYNLLCAIGITIKSGLSYKDIHVDKLISPKGRLERVNHFSFIDYAHTPNALKHAILSLKWHFNKKIVLVFGCGGNRDYEKRAEMGKVAHLHADIVIITDDNPRNEDPMKIRKDILLQCPNALEVSDRMHAIECGVNIAYDKGMILLIAGKGHEKLQIVAGKIFDLDEAKVIIDSYNRCINHKSINIR